MSVPKSLNEQCMNAKRYLYTAWFRDTRMAPSDQDYEWPACFLIEAATPHAALSWGDRLARGFSQRRITEVYLKSSVEDESDVQWDLSTLPVIQVGYEASDEEIGW
jgi:hypothetical protein